MLLLVTCIDVKFINVLQATFDPEVFFNVILPPIIFNAGFSMKKVFQLHDCYIGKSCSSVS